MDPFFAAQSQYFLQAYYILVLLISGLLIILAQANDELPPLVYLGKIMHLIFMPILALADPAMSSGAVIIVILSVAAVIRSKMP